MGLEAVMIMLVAPNALFPTPAGPINTGFDFLKQWFM